jgi:hypothetical protein
MVHDAPGVLDSRARIEHGVRNVPATGARGARSSDLALGALGAMRALP